jgi:hypothetical protein
MTDSTRVKIRIIRVLMAISIWITCGRDVVWCGAIILDGQYR